MNSIRLRWSAILVVIFLALPPLAFAAQYPKPGDNYVNDFAGVLQPQTAGQLRERLEKFELRTGIEGTIVTVKSIGEYGTGDTSVESFATNLFNAWGVGNKPRNDGFMILVSIGDRRARIELGDGWGTLHNADMQRIISEVMVPRFKAGDYNGGIEAGTFATMRSLSSWFRENQGWLIPLIALTMVAGLVALGISLIRDGKKGWGWACLALAAVILLWLIMTILKGAARKTTGGFGGGRSSGRGGASGGW